MRGLFTNKSVNIQAGQAVSGISNAPQTMRIMSGRVWITVEGVKLDYWLKAGDTFAVIPGRLVVVEADHTPSRVDLMPNRHQSSLAGIGTQVKNLTQRLLHGKRGDTISVQRAAACSPALNCCA